MARGQDSGDHSHRRVDRERFERLFGPTWSLGGDDPRPNNDHSDIEAWGGRTNAQQRAAGWADSNVPQNEEQD